MTRPSLKTIFSSAILLAVIASAATDANAQMRAPSQSEGQYQNAQYQNAPPGSYSQSRGYRHDAHINEYIHDERVRTVADYSWIYIDPPEKKVFKVNDIVTVMVSEKAQVTVQSNFNRQKTAKLVAELKEFVRLGKGGKLLNAAANAPTIEGNVNGTITATGQVNETEGITYRIAATVVDIHPNGNLILEARKSIRTNDDNWVYSLTGVVRFDDIQANNTILSENIANMQIVKKQGGKVFDSTKRGWGVKIYDKIWPF